MIKYWQEKEEDISSDISDTEFTAITSGECENSEMCERKCENSVK